MAINYYDAREKCMKAIRGSLAVAGGEAFYKPLMVEFYDKELFPGYVFRAAVKELEKLNKVEIITKEGQEIIRLIGLEELTDAEKEILQSEPKPGSIPKDTAGKLETK